jgi:hypothetical protein
MTKRTASEMAKGGPNKGEPMVRELFDGKEAMKSFWSRYFHPSGARIENVSLFLRESPSSSSDFPSFVPF